MPDETKNLTSAVKRARQDPCRSPLFHWLKQNFARVEPLTKVTRVDWVWVRDEINALGITDSQGNAPTDKTLYRTLRKVAIEVEAKRARRREIKQSAVHQRTPASDFPSRLPATLRPPIAGPPASQTSPFGLPASPSPAQPASGRKSTPEEAMARLRQVLAERSR